MHLFQKPFFTSLLSLELISLITILSIIVIHFSQCRPAPLDPDNPNEECTYDALSAVATPSSLDLSSGSSGDVTMTVQVSSTNCINMGNNFKVVLAESNPAGITISGCGFQAMSQNTGNCQFTVRVPNDTDPGTYAVELKTTVSLRSKGEKELFSSVNVNVPSPTDYRLAITPPVIGVIQGKSFSITADIERLGGHSESINMSLDYLPQRLSYVYEPNPIPGDENSSQLTITAEPNAVPGDYSIRAICTDGAIERFITFPLYVNEPFSLSVEPTNISITQGQNNTVEVTVEPEVGGFNDWVMLTTESSIIGQGANLVDTTFNPNPLPPVDVHTSELTLTVGESVPPGTYPIIINGLGGVVTKSIELQLTVSEKK